MLQQLPACVTMVEDDEQTKQEVLECTDFQNGSLRLKK